MSLLKFKRTTAMLIEPVGAGAKLQYVVGNVALTLAGTTSDKTQISAPKNFLRRELNIRSLLVVVSADVAT